MLASSKENFTKKQVRFNSSNMSSPSDAQAPRPLKEIQNTRTFGMPNDGSTKNKCLFSDSVYLPPRLFDTKLKNDNGLIPKPSDELELSVLDTSDHRFGQHDSRGYPKTIDDMTLNRKMFENDSPYSFSPSKMPLARHVPPSQRNLNEISRGLMSSAAESKKEFPIDKPRISDSLGFFTLPNSGGIHGSKENFSPLTTRVAETKKSLYTNRQAIGDSNPRCCGEAAPQKTHVPNIQVPQTKNLNSNYRSPNVFHKDYNRIENNPRNGTDNIHFAHSQLKESCCGRNDIPCHSVNSCTPIHSDQNRCNQLTNFNGCNCDNVCSRRPLTTCNSYNPCCSQSTNNRNQSDERTETVVDGLEAKRRAIELKNGRRKTKDDEKVNEEMDVINRDKNEPTVSDLYEIIKMQNQQLQMLQQRVDKLLTVKESSIGQQFVSNKQIGDVPKVPQDAAVNVNCIEHISIGVMTSFEMVRSSNYSNKRNVTFGECRDECVQTTRNAPDNAVSLSKSDGRFDTRDSPKTVVDIGMQAVPNEMCDIGNEFNAQKTNKENVVNFLDGIEHYDSPSRNEAQGNKDNRIGSEDNISCPKDPFVTPKATINRRNGVRPNVQVDLYENTREVSMEAHAGWTFYNNVMNRVNNILHSPPSTEDRSSPTNIVIQKPGFVQNQRTAAPKRVTMEAPPIFQMHHQPSTELSIHMRQLAAKYNIPSAARTVAPQVRARETLDAQLQVMGNPRDVNMSLATMQYMQRYQLLAVTNERQQQYNVPEEYYNMAGQEGGVGTRNHIKPAYRNPSRILDITTLKQQPKLL